MAAAPFLLRVVPQGPDGPWDVKEPRTGRVLATSGTAEAATREAAQLLAGGVVQVLNDGGFLVGRLVVPLPTVPLRTILRRSALTLGLALVFALVLSQVLGTGVWGAVIGVAIGGQLVPLWRVLAARRSASRETRG